MSEDEAISRGLPWLEAYLRERDSRIVATVGETQAWTVDRKKRPDGLAVGMYGSGATLTLAAEAKSYRLLREVVLRVEEGGDLGRKVVLAGLGAVIAGPVGALVGLGLAWLLGERGPRVLGQLGRYPASFRVVVVPAELLVDVPRSRRKLLAAYRREGVGLLEVGERDCGLLVDPVLVRNVGGEEWLDWYSRAAKIRRRLFEGQGRG
jgi:hypothetical protein